MKTASFIDIHVLFPSVLLMYHDFIFFWLFMQAHVNVPCSSKATQYRTDKKSLFTSTTDVQVSGLFHCILSKEFL